MANNGPISVSAPGTSLINATGDEVIFNTKYPFWMLDSTNDVSFEIITLFFAKNPPVPDGTISTYQRTLIYSFPHGYTYVPSTWFLVSTDNFQTARGSEGVYLYGGGAAFALSSAVLVIEADTINVNFYIDMYWDTTVVASPAPTVLGLFVAIRSYVSVDGLLGDAVPTHV